MQHRHRRCRLAAAVLATSTLALGAAHAAPISGPSSLTVAGVSFGNFSCTVTGAGASSPGSCGGIAVSANPQGDGIEFSSGFVALPGSFADATINYQAQDAAGINGVSLGFNGIFLGQAVASVTETIRDAATNAQVGFLQVSCGPGSCTRNDPDVGFIPLNGTYTNLLVEKDITVAAGLGYADTSIIDQGYRTNVPANVPEPASVALFGVSLVGFGMLARRKRDMA